MTHNVVRLSDARVSAVVDKALELKLGDLYIPGAHAVYREELALFASSRIDLLGRPRDLLDAFHEYEASADAAAGKAERDKDFLVYKEALQRFKTELSANPSLRRRFVEILIRDFLRERMHLAQGRYASKGAMIEGLNADVLAAHALDAALYVSKRGWTPSPLSHLWADFWEWVRKGKPTKAG